MDDVDVPPGQDQGGEGAGHAGQGSVGVALDVQPAVGCGQRGDGVGFDAFQGTELVLGFEEEADGGFGGDPAAFGAADSVGEGGDQARAVAVGQEAGSEVLVPVAAARVGGGADLHAECFRQWRPLVRSRDS